ncbi:MAG: hypothetical protein V1660_01410 [archaeon]
MAKESEDIALFDMDGTLCDYEGGLIAELQKLKAPNEPDFFPQIREDMPDYIKERSDLIRSSEGWWANLPKLKSGFDILENAKNLDYKIMILTQGPRRNPHAWSGKKLWIDKNLGQDIDITITRDKGLVYGKILVDDCPEYISRWLEWRPRGLVIMPKNESNKSFIHHQVIRYNGENLEEVITEMKRAKTR